MINGIKPMLSPRTPTPKGLCKQLEIEDEFILEDMRSSDYEQLINTFDMYFGDYVDLER